MIIHTKEKVIKDHYLPFILEIQIKYFDIS
jgi:hypothetical protein